MEELTKTDSFIDTELKRFENIITKEALVTLADSVKDLTISGPEDKAGLKAVIEGRKTLKAQRVAIQKEAKSIRESAVRFQKAVIAMEGDFVALLEPVETLLEEREANYYADRERLRLEEEKRESDRIQAMIDKLGAVRHAVDFHELKALTEVQFQNILSEATIKYNSDLKAEEEDRQRQYELRLQEETRLAQAQKEQEERERKFKIEQAELEEKFKRVRAEQEARQREIDEANDKIRKEQEAKDEELKARQRELERQEQERIEAARKEQEAKEAEARKKQEEIDRKKREKEEKEDALKFGEDQDRFAFLAQQIDVQFLRSQVWGFMKSKKGREVSSQIQSALQVAFSLATQNAKPIIVGENKKSKGIAKEEIDINYDFHEGRGENNELL